MTKEEFDTLIETLVTKGIEITLKLHNGKIMYDLNTGMKSDLYLYYDASTNQCLCYGRYDHTGTINNFIDVLTEVEWCLHGRDFGNREWLDLLYL